MGLGGMELATTALAVLSPGSAVGGWPTAYTAWRRGAAAHIPMLSALLAVALVLPAASAEILSMLPFGAAMFLTGLCIARCWLP
jgi:hypothetical protein